MVRPRNDLQSVEWDIELLAHLTVRLLVAELYGTWSFFSCVNFERNCFAMILARWDSRLLSLILLVFLTIFWSIKWFNYCIIWLCENYRILGIRKKVLVSFCGQCAPGHCGFSEYGEIHFGNVLVALNGCERNHIFCCTLIFLYAFISSRVA